MNLRLLAASAALLSSTSFVAAQNYNRVDVAGEFCTIQLTSGVMLDACVERIEHDTVYLETATGRHLVLPGSMVAHGIFDVPSQGTWRPREDQRRPWSTRLLLDLNVSKAEYGSEEPRGGAQAKLAVVNRVTDRFLVGPFVGIAAMRANYHETVVPIGANLVYELTPRVNVSTDLGYGFGVVTGPNVRKASGGFHANPRINVRLSHPYNPFNIEFGIGYLYQKASFTRFEDSRFIAEAVLRPGVPGNFIYTIPYHRLSFGITCTIF